MFISVDGKSKLVKEIYAGGTDGKAHRITELFGSVNGIAKQLFSTEKEASVFDQYTWADIKQLANDGLLLEHFNLYDKVAIKLKEPLRNEMNVYISGNGYIKVPQIQTEMMLQIIELTGTKMRLMCPRVSVLGTASSIVNNTGSETSGAFKADLQVANSAARTSIDQAWGMTPMYDALKAIQNALPDDLLDVLSVCTRPMTQYTHHAITGSLIRSYDEDMRVRQLSSNLMKKTVDVSDPEVIYPIIQESYFPTSLNEYLYHIRLPEEYDNYENRRNLVSGMFKGFKLMNHTYTILSGKTYVKQSYSTAPYASCYFTNGITTSTEYDSYMDAGSLGNDLEGKLPVNTDVVFPEMIIEAE